MEIMREYSNTSTSPVFAIPLDVNSMIGKVRMELEEQRNQNNRLYQEKVETASRAKQQSQEETCYQLEKLREKMEEDQEKVVDKFKSEILSRDDENQQLKADIHSLRQGEDDICLTLEKMEKMIISEINDECKKTAHLLGVTPRKTHSSGFSPKSKDHKKSRTMAASAIANLRACNEELRNTIRELREDAETLKIALNKTKKSKELELSQLRKQLTKEKSTDMDDLKMRLTQSLNESSALEQRVKLAELKAHLAEERAARNQTLLNAKLQEVNHLQSTLNSQTKEILGMERSFDELRHGAYSPTRFNYTTKT